MSKRDAPGGRAWSPYVAAFTVGAAVLLLVRLTHLPGDDAVRDFVRTSFGARNSTVITVGSGTEDVLLDPPNLMVLVPADPKKTKAAQESLAAMRAKMKKDFEDQWARLTPDEQTAMRKQWKEDWQQQQADNKRRKAERAARRKAAAQGAATSRRLLRGPLPMS